jgi:flagellar L-ring protein precursor FlgH
MSGRTLLRSSLLLIVLSSLTAATVRADGNPGSLWQEHGGFFRNRKAALPGDILTILIDESAVAGSEARTKTEKSTSQNVRGEAGLGFLDFIDPFSGGLTTQDDFEGKGETRRSGQLSARMSATIVEVLPTGNYRVQGTREVVINQEKQRLVLEGIVRPEDIRSDNTVLSAFLAEARIRYDGKGTVHQSQRKGLFTRLLSLLF